MEHELDTIRIGTMKLYVNLPKYSKQNDALYMSEKRRNTKVTHAANIPTKMEKSGSGKIIQIKECRVKEKGKNKEQNKGIHRNKPNTGSEWK